MVANVFNWTIILCSKRGTSVTVLHMFLSLRKLVLATSYIDVSNISHFF